MQYFLDDNIWFAALHSGLNTHLAKISQKMNEKSPLVITFYLPLFVFLSLIDSPLVIIQFSLSLLYYGRR